MSKPRRPSARTSAAAVAALLAVLSLAPAASAWSFKEHAQFARLAVRRLVADPTTPPDMRAWLVEITPGVNPDGSAPDAPAAGAPDPTTRPASAPSVLDSTALQVVPGAAYEEDYLKHAAVGIDPVGLDGLLRYAVQPDMDRQTLPKGTVVEPFGLAEDKMHYLDAELFLPPGERNQYRPDLSGKPGEAAFPRDPKDARYVQAGMLPFRAEQSYRKLVGAIRAGRLVDPAGRPETPSDSDTAERWAGYLAHYAADNTQPQHATIDYKSATYFENRRTAPNVHSEVEYRMLDDKDESFDDLRAELWPKLVEALRTVTDPSTTDDVWQSTVQVTLYSYDALPIIGEGAVGAVAAAKAEAATRPATLEQTGHRPEGQTVPLDTRAFFRHAGTLRGEPATVLDMKAEQSALAVIRIQKLLRQAWREGTGE